MKYLSIFLFILLSQLACSHSYQMALRKRSGERIDKVVRSNSFNIDRGKDLNKLEKREERFIDKSLDLFSQQDRKLVSKWLNYFQNNGRKDFQGYIERGAKYKTIVKNILESQNVPIYFYYLAMIESGFKVHARSHASAVGMWQFMAGTAKRYGLKVNSYIDERRDPIRSTIAAAQYLKDLYNVFNSWFLAMAAYNSGEGRVMNAIMKHGSRDYWELVKKKALPRETRNYIPKFIAAFLIGSHPDKYFFQEDLVKDSLHLVSITVPSPVRLVDIARVLQEDVKKIKNLNPHLIRGITSPYTSTYRIWIEKNDVSLAKVQQLKRLRKVKNIGYFGNNYRVRRGDSLIKIAKNFRVSVRSIKLNNNLKSDRIRVGQVLSIGTSNNKKSAKHRTYRVRKGDTLFTIARKYRTTVKRVRLRNKLRSHKIYPGQILKL